MTYDDKPENAEHRDTEITLSNTTLLLIFLGVAIICGVFFGFGYTVGKRNAAPAVAIVTPPTAPKSADLAEAAPPVITPAPVVSAPVTPAPTETPAAAPAMTEKPSAAATTHMSPTPPTPTPVVKATPAPAPVAKPTPPPPVMKATPPPATVAAKVAPTAAPAVVTSRPVMVTKPTPVPAKTKKPATTPAPTPTPAPAPAAPSRTYVVQVAAVSHQADADVLVGALRRKGIAANAFPGTQDNLIHVQVGPFSSQKDAAAMRDHLSDEGYLAIVK